MTIAQEHSFGYSPPNSSPESHLGSMLYDDDSKDGLFDEVLEKPRKSTGRKGPGPIAADKRATHNAIERARRESLNGRFMTLAEALPSMANVKRPSKSIIVNKALDFVFDAQVKEHALIKENNELRRQVDQLRARLGMAPLPPPAPLLAPAAEKAAAPAPAPATAHQFPQYHQSFTSAEGFGAEELAHAMGGAASSNSSPEQQQLPSPSTASPTSPTSTTQMDNPSPTLSYPQLSPNNIFGESPVPVESTHSPSPASVVVGGISAAPQTASPAAFLPVSGAPHLATLAQSQAQAAALLQLGYMNPHQNLLSPQHTALLALHLQQQAQVQQQHLQHQQQQHQHHTNHQAMNDLYGMTATPGAGAINPWLYNPANATIDASSYTFMSQ